MGGQRAHRLASQPPQPPLPIPATLSLGKDLSFANAGSLNLAVGADKGQFSVLRIESSASDTFIGHVMVFRTFEKVSYGLVMDSIRPSAVNDLLKHPEAVQ